MKKSLIPQEIIASKIYLVRNKKVMLDRDLAELYGVETRQLTRQVRRNSNRFPEDFMFQLSKKEFGNLKCQFGTSSWGGTRKLPLAFTEHGILMLSSVLNSKRAIQVNIQIMRIFIKMKEMLHNYKELQRKIDHMEKKYDEQFRIVFEAIKQLIKEEQKPKKSIGFHAK